MHAFRLQLSIALLSAAIISFQLALIQVLSIVQWYHFAYMVISMALLGFGAAGTALAVFSKSLLRHAVWVIPASMLLTAVTMPIVLDVSQSSFFRFDAYLLFTAYRHTGKLLLSYLLFFIPFFFGALALGLIFVKYVKQIGKLYFVNLLGSGVGGILALVLAGVFFPQEIPALLAILPLLAALLIIRARKIALGITALIACTLIVWKIVQPPKLAVSQYKDISKAMLLPDADVLLRKPSPEGLIEAVSSPVMRYAPGLSLMAQTTAQVKAAVFLNGDWFGAITDWNRGDTVHVLNYTTLALPYAMAHREKVLVLQAATGIDITHALTNNAGRVAAVASNAALRDALQEGLAGLTDSLFFQPGVAVHQADARTFLLSDTAHYDLITLPIVGSFGGSSGLAALQEQFILTKEAFAAMWARLSDGGAIAVTTWMDYPVRNPLKILATIMEVLAEAGVADSRQHIAAVRSWGTISFVLTKSPLRAGEIANIRSFCDRMMFDADILPQVQPGTLPGYNALQDDRFFQYAGEILSGRSAALYRDYPFEVKPATDNNPYFSQFIKWSGLRRISDISGGRSIPFLELGYIIVAATFLQLLLASVLLILLPLFRLGWTGKHKGQVILYFSGLGLGYMFVEMVFIQRFILYFGNPVYAASAVITFLLIFSGIGSYVSERAAKKPGMPAVFVAIILLLLVYAFLLTPALRQTIRFPVWGRVLTGMLLVAPVAFLMGMPFPRGLSAVSILNEAAVPWAWGINGCVSVVSTVLATILAVETGFTAVMSVAVLAYGIAFLVFSFWNRKMISS